MQNLKSKYLEYINCLNLLLKVNDQKQFPKFICIVGDEDYFINKTLKDIKSIFLKFPNSKIIYAQDDLKKRFGIDEFNEKSLFKENNLFIIEDAQKYDEKFFLNFKINASSNYICFIFLTNSLSKSLEETLARLNPFIIHVNPPKFYNDWITFVNNICNTYKISLSDDAQKFLLDILNQDAVLIENEIRNLSLIFAESLKKLQIVDIKPYLNVFKEEEIFKIKDYILNNEIDKAIAFSTQAITKGESPLAILSILAKHCKQSIELIELLQKQKPVEQHTQLPTFMIKKYINYVNKVSNKKIFCDALKLIYEADLKFKSSKIDYSLIITEIIKTFDLKDTLHV